MVIYYLKVCTNYLTILLLMKKMKIYYVVEAGDEVDVFDDTVYQLIQYLGVPVFPVIHNSTKQKIYVSLDDIEKVSFDDVSRWRFNVGNTKK